MEDKATPRPWAADIKSESGGNTWVNGPDGVGIVVLSFMGGDGSMTIANANLIVKAVNAHDELIAALEATLFVAYELLDEMNDDLGANGLDPWVEDLRITAARAALLKAKGET